LKLLLLISLLFSTLLGAQPSYKAELDSHTLATMLAKNEIVLFDIRTKAEWHESGVIEKSHLVTFFDEKGRYNMAAFMAEFNKHVPHKKNKIAFICRSGSRTLPVASHFASLGYSEVYNVTRGILGWQSEKRKLIKP
jgi:rhodanese-related sulfurtransferase